MFLQQQKPGATYVGMSGKNSPVNSVGSMSDDLSALSIGTPTRRLSSRLTNAGANLVVKTSPKEGRGDARSQGDRLRAKKSPQGHSSPTNVRYSTRSAAARGMFRK